jgi:hypothetical protein
MTKMTKTSTITPSLPGQHVCNGPLCQGRHFWPTYYFTPAGICAECDLAALARPPSPKFVDWTEPVRSAGAVSQVSRRATVAGSKQASSTYRWTCHIGRAPRVRVKPNQEQFEARRYRALATHVLMEEDIGRYVEASVVRARLHRHLHTTCFLSEREARGREVWAAALH